ncbi:MAG: DUF882 domain-containing protein [Rhizobiaceae bacterium]|nr:DUF882 domain-containing protein [Rhizobiaceae bacterium]
MYYIIAEDDPELPEQVAYRPSLSDGGEPLPTGDAGALPAVDDAVLAARMGSNGTYLETVPQQQVAIAAPPPEPPKRRGFFASLFAEPAPERPEPVRVQTQAPAPQTAGQPAAESANAEIGQPGTELAAAGDTQPVAEAQPTTYVENRPREAVAPTREEPRRRGFLSAFFSNAEAAPRVEPRRPQPVISMATIEQPVTAAAANTNVYGRDALPGVRDTDSLYEISRKSGLDDDSDIDINEGDGLQLAMAPGLARLTPNGLMVQTERVDVACLKPSLVRVLKAIENHYGERVIVTSGYRSPPHNQRARGARNSLHMYCAAADIQVPGIDKWELAQYLRSMPGRGGVGTYCHTKSVHVDVGPERDWNWRCRRRRG